MQPGNPAGADPTRPALRAAMFTSAALIAYQVAGKATRDAFFLSTHDVTGLPAAVTASAVFSVLAVLVASRILARWGPGRVVPELLVVSGLLLLGEWGVARAAPRIASTLVFLHFNALGALLISSFWSMVGEHFDPRTAKRHVGRIGAAGTLGGLAGGFLAEGMGASFPVAAMLPALATIHFVAAWTIRGLAASPRIHDVRTAQPSLPPVAITGVSGVATIVRTPYLRTLVVIVLLGAVVEGLVDYTFKARAVSAYGTGSALMQIFAAFYTGVQVVTFLVQAWLTRRALEGMGLARTVAALPTATGVAAAGMAFAPGLLSATLARAVEAVLHNSLYRSSYELLFTPVPREEKRAAKPLVDVGCNRLGDAIGAGIVQAALMLAPLAALRILPVVAVVLAALSVAIALHLHQAYLRALEKSLLSRAIQIDLPDLEDSTTRSAFLSTVGTLTPPRAEPRRSANNAARPSDPMLRVAQQADPELRRIAALRSGDAVESRAALAEPLTSPVVAFVIPLLAWDEVAPDAIRALRAVARAHAGQLVDALLDQDQEFAVRRRLPGVLVSAGSQRTSEGLLRALEDPRFEVRYRAGRALAKIAEREPNKIPESVVIAAVIREANVGKSVWESQRVLDRPDEDESSPFVDEFLRDRASRSLEHVFTLLSLILPPEPLSVAFRGLHTDDPLLRGTALEYLESLLPQSVRVHLWPFLEDRGEQRTARPRADVLADLMRSNLSIALNLEKLRDRPGA